MYFIKVFSDYLQIYAHDYNIAEQYIMKFVEIKELNIEVL